MLTRQFSTRLYVPSSFALEKVRFESEDIIEIFRNHLKTISLPKLNWTPQRHAAIVVPLCILPPKEKGNPPRASILLTVRQSKLSRHGGEISFPGGMFDSELDSPVTNDDYSETAKRETHEELDWPREAIDIIGSLPPIPDKTRTVQVHPYIAVLRDDNGKVSGSRLNQFLNDPTTWAVQQAEVAAVLLPTLDSLTSKERLLNLQMTNGKYDTGRLGAHIVNTDGMISCSWPLADSSSNLTETWSGQYPSKYPPIWGLTSYVLQFALTRVIFHPDVVSQIASKL